MINESYGYLWWLNGKNSFMVPQSQIKFPGSLFKNAPSDMFSALGKNGQFINVVPSQKMVWIRMGDNPDNSLVPFLFNEDIWKYINNLSCTSSTKDDASISNNYKIYPNPVTDQLMLENTTGNVEAVQYKILDAMGKVFINNQFEGSSFMIDTQILLDGIYFMVIQNKHATQSIKFVKR